MYKHDKSPSFASQHSTSSANSNENEAWASPDSVRYEPVRVRVCRKPALTLITGRRSKHLMLVGDEAVQREKRRERNREAARKLKEKRQIIEDELNQKIKDLEGEHSDLHDHLEQLRQIKQRLEEDLKNLLIDPLNDLLSNDNQDILLFFEQHSNELDESLESIIDGDSHASFSSLMDE